MPILPAILIAIAWQAVPPPPPPPGPPSFMSMTGLPLACFDKPTFEEDGLEFFVCNGGGGTSGVRKKDDASHTVFVRDPDIAQNLDMKAAKLQCAGKGFSVASEGPGLFYFRCAGKEMKYERRFKADSKTNWKRYDKYLNK